MDTDDIITKKNERNRVRFCADIESSTYVKTNEIYSGTSISSGTIPKATTTNTITHI